jgi:thiamine pyrophosphokinase
LRAVIFANGRLSDPLMDRSLLRADDWILAADGGAVHCRELGVVPAAVIGDLDSAPSDEVDRLKAVGVEIIRHPQRKDETDLELAIAYACQAGADEVLILGAMGDRWDQTIANLLLLSLIDLPSGRALIVDGVQQVGLLRGGETFPLRGQPGDVVSLLPIAGDASGITTDGLEYALQASTLRFGATRGVSNLLLRTDASVSLREGKVLVVLIRTPAALVT